MKVKRSVQILVSGYVIKGMRFWAHTIDISKVLLLLLLLFLSSAQKDQIRDNVVAQVLIDDPVHELETRERHREDDSAVLVDIRSRHPEHLVELFHVALRIRRRRGRRTRRSRGRRRRTRYLRRRRTAVVVSVTAGLRVIRVPAPETRGRRRRPPSRRVFAASVVVMVSADGVLPRTAFAVHFWVVNLEVNSLKMERKSVSSFVLTSLQIH